MLRKLHARIVLAILLLAVSASSHALFHLWTISQVYSNASGTLQFIELTTTAPGQDLLQGHAISSNSNVFNFPSNLPSSDTSNKKFLIGTAGIAAASGVTPDYIIFDGFVFTSNVTINFAGFDIVGPISAIPTDGTLSLNRSGPNSFATATNSFKNFAGTPGTVVVSNPTTPPGAPLNVTATPGNTQATIFFSPPSSAGSSAIVRYDVTCLGGFSTRTAFGTASPITVTGLSNTFTYDCSITATNATNTGPPATVSVTPTAPVTVPDAPTITNAADGNTQATISFNPPGNDGGASINNYIVTCGTATATGQTSPVTVGGLSNGTTYSCTVAATNSMGTGPQSAAVSVTPGTVPGVPGITGAVPGNAQATISFTAPADGGSQIQNYGVNCNPGPVIAGGFGSPITVTGLVNGTGYTCTVTAINRFGPGAASAPVNVTPATVPGAPTIGTATAGNTSASIAFSGPASNGGSAITGFTATCNPGTISVTSTVSPINVPGLVNGTGYTCAVTATNAFGTGAASATVNVVPATIPGAPTIGATIPGDGRGSVSFTAPTSNGGSAIVSFTATCGGLSATGFASPITVTGLANDISVACSVIATNGVGAGPASANAAVTPSASAPLTPVAVVARKTHGATGIFDLPANTTPGAVTAEPRTLGTGHVIVFQFNKPITAIGAVTVTPPVGTLSAVISGFDVVVTLNNIADNQRATVSLPDVNGPGVNVAATFGFLVGDLNNTGSVNASDISGVKARLGQATTGQNFRFDINATGAVNATDVSAVKARSGLLLPP